MFPQKFYVYILYSKNIDKYYIGVTYNLELRLARHKFGSSRFTKQTKDWQLVYKKEYDSRVNALRREKYIKRMKSRIYIEELTLAG